MRFLVGAWLMLGLVSTSGAALGQSKGAGKAKAAAKAQAKGAPAPKAKKVAKPVESEPDKDPAEAPPEAAEETSKPTTEGETKVKAAGTSGADASKTPVKAKEKEGPEGVKTYQFGAIEVEGHLKSPQLIYFLRRVRAEFEAGALGHRSFLGELSDTRNEPTFR
jgi:hypothetical protein